MFLTISSIICIFVSVLVYAYVLIESFKMKMSIEKIDRDTREQILRIVEHTNSSCGELDRKIDRFAKTAEENLDSYKNLKRDEYNSLRASVAASARAAKRERQDVEPDSVEIEESELERRYKQTNNLEELFGVESVSVPPSNSPKRLIRKG